jgi:hypothetical protein
MYFVAYNAAFRDYKFLDESVITYPYWLANKMATKFTETAGLDFIKSLKKLGFEQIFELIPVENLKDYL